MSIASEPQKRVFISYAHASDEHKLGQKACESLRSQSITVTLDQDDCDLVNLSGNLRKMELALLIDCW